MSTYVVLFDLRTGPRYEGLMNRVLAYPTRWNTQPGVCVIETTKSAAQLRDHLLEGLEASDKVFVGRLSGEAAWTSSFGDQVTGWLRGRLQK